MSTKEKKEGDMEMEMHLFPDMPPVALKPRIDPLLTCMSGTNADLFAAVLPLYIKPGSRIADVTYGRGIFWQHIPEGAYNLVPSDILLNGVDFRHLPYEDESFDALVFDPPYIHGGKTVKKSLNDCYHNANENHESVLALYLAGILEARRVLVRKTGILFVKCQDEIEGGRQRLTHTELLTVLPMIGFQIEDLFVLHVAATPLMREQYQLHARKNHSYLIVARRAR